MKDNALSKMLTLQLRPHISAMLDEYLETVRQRLPENVRAKITRSLLVRKLLASRDATPEALRWLGPQRRFRDDSAVQLRIRVSEREYQHAAALGLPYARAISALVLAARYPDGNFPANPDTNDDTATKDHHAHQS